RRPNVVSAISEWRQKSVIWLRIWSFFIAGVYWEISVGKSEWRGCPTTICPTGIRAENGNTVIGTRHASPYIRRQNITFGVRMLKPTFAAAMLLLAAAAPALAGYLDENPDEVFSAVYERLGA